MAIVDQKRAARLRDARQDAGFDSAAEAADALDVAIPTYQAHENGNRGFRWPEAERYARLFGVRIEWLVFGRGPMKIGGASLQGRIEALPPSQQEQVLRFLEFVESGAAMRVRREMPEDERGYPPRPTSKPKPKTGT